MDEGDYLRLVQALSAAFGGTGQVVPGAGNAPSGGFLTGGLAMNTKTGIIQGTSAGGLVTIWYLEDGFETVVPASLRGAYTGRESNWQLVQAVADGAVRSSLFVQPNQAGQLRDALDLAYCQPAVGAWFNFELRDEQSLAGWQSGLLYADGTPKPSYSAFKSEIAAVAAGQVDCSRFATSVSGIAPATS